MSLNLDPRQRAILQEMGVHVWLPQTTLEALSGAQNAIDSEAAYAYEISARGLKGLEKSSLNSPAAASHGAPHATLHATAEAAADASAQTAALALSAAPKPAPAAVTHKSAAPVLPRAAGPVQVMPLPAGIASMDWTQLKTTAADCQACAMCLGRRAAVLAVPEPALPCDWLVVGEPPDDAQERQGLPFVDEAGVLLDNMLRAVGVRRCTSAVPDQAAAASSNLETALASMPQALPANSAPSTRAYLTHVVKCRPALNRAPTADELATCAHYLRREIALVQPKVILAMGRFAMLSLLTDTPPEHTQLPLGQLRGQVWRFAGVPLVVTYPPSYLLRHPSDKAKAWADLCLALEVVQGKLGG